MSHSDCRKKHHEVLFVGGVLDMQIIPIARSIGVSSLCDMPCHVFIPNSPKHEDLRYMCQIGAVYKPIPIQTYELRVIDGEYQYHLV